jgi:large subunit ribosomal protein L10
MTREEKREIIDSLVEQITETKNFYLTDIEALNAEQSSNLRRKCFENEIKLIMVKNTLLKKAFESFGDDRYEELYEVLKKNTSVMFCEKSNVPAKLIKEFRKGNDKPVLKAAYVEESAYVGEENLEALINIKSKEELIGDLIGLLQSPAKNVVSALQSGGQTLTGVLKTLSEKEG